MINEKSIVAYFDSLNKWKEELLLLADLCRERGLEESIKWGIPKYSFKGKNVIGLVGFKNHFAIWFHQGVLSLRPS